MTHGWPGSFLEFEQALGPLTDPPAHGGDAADAFDVVVPSLPGYGFSGKLAGAGWDVHRIARAWAELMTRLGYDRFLAQVTGWFTTATGDTIAVPAGCSIFPREVPRPSRRWAPRRFTNIVYWNEPDRGGHFAAWEQPSTFISEVRAVARSCARPRW
jgi:pimeloyl-ACP methyl ester carboxylesterase